MNFSYCPRCGDRTYEYLDTHSYCVSCNYSPTTDEKYDHAVPKWALDVLNESERPEELLPLASPKPLVGFVPRLIRTETPAAKAEPAAS